MGGDDGDIPGGDQGLPPRHVELHRLQPQLAVRGGVHAEGGRLLPAECRDSRGPRDGVHPPRTVGRLRPPADRRGVVRRRQRPQVGHTSRGNTTKNYNLAIYYQ